MQSTLDRYLTARARHRLVFVISPMAGRVLTAQVVETPVEDPVTEEAPAVPQVDWFAEAGGQIILSTDVNVQAASGLLGWLKSKGQTLLNRWLRQRKTQEVMTEYTREHDLALGWTVGAGLSQGRYVSPDGKVYDEKSFVIDIRGAPMNEIVLPLAQELGRAFSQESVLVVDHESGRAGLLTT